MTEWGTTVGHLEQRWGHAGKLVAKGPASTGEVRRLGVAGAAKITFVDDRSTERWTIECAYSYISKTIIGGHMEKTNAFR